MRIEHKAPSYRTSGANRAQGSFMLAPPMRIEHEAPSCRTSGAYRAQGSFIPHLRCETSTRLSCRTSGANRAQGSFMPRLRRKSSTRLLHAAPPMRIEHKAPSCRTSGANRARGFHAAPPVLLDPKGVLSC